MPSNKKLERDIFDFSLIDENQIEIENYLSNSFIPNELGVQFFHCFDLAEVKNIIGEEKDLRIKLKNNGKEITLKSSIGNRFNVNEYGVSKSVLDLVLQDVTNLSLLFFPCQFDVLVMEISKKNKQQNEHGGDGVKVKIPGDV